MKKKYLFTYVILDYLTLTKLAELGKLENNIVFSIETNEWNVL